MVSCSTRAEPSAVTVATNDVSNRATPATVGFDGNLRLVGDPADAKVTQLPKQVLNYLPAVLGTAEAAKAAWDRYGCQWPLAEDGKLGPVPFGGKDVALRPACCLAALLQKLVSFATGPAAVEAGVAQAFEAAVAVPDAWGDAELSALRAAVDILGWKPELVRVLPYSATLATAYAQRIGQKLSEGEERRVVAFVDVGFSQSSVTVGAFSPSPEGSEVKELAVEVLGVASAPKLGTQALCRTLFDYIMAKKVPAGQEPVALSSKRGARLMVALQKGLKDLSMLPDTTVALECFFPDEGDLKVDLSRAMFEELAQPLLQELAATAGEALSKASVGADAVHSVELIGGGMRIPRVQQMLSELFPSKDSDQPAAEEAGAAAKGTPSLSSRLRFGLDGASALATGAAHYSAGRRAVKVPWDLSAQKSALAGDAELAECRELEAWMAKTNSEEVQRLEKQNELESYLYEVRSWLSGPERALLKPDVTEPLVEELNTWFEDAQYDEATTLAVYTEKLESLKKQLEEHGSEYFEKKRKEKEALEKRLDEEAEKERQRRHDLGMDADKDDRKMAKSERLKMAGKNKEEGNTVFKAGNLEDAAGRYQRALQHLKKFLMLDYSPEEKAEADAITLSVNLNLAQVYLKQAAAAEKESKEKAEGFYQKAKASADEALSVDADNIKAKFRKATALEKLGDLDAASKEVKTALKLDPENADLTKLKERLDRLQAAQTAKAKKMYGKMFG